MHWAHERGTRSQGLAVVCRLGESLIVGGAGLREVEAPGEFDAGILGTPD
jgi:hypothetical protein